MPKRGPGEAMGGRFDINGSIWLSDLLDAGPQTVEAEALENLESVLAAALPFRERLTARVRAIRNQIVRRYENPFTAADRLPGAADTRKTLGACGARPKTNKKAAERAAHALSGAFTKRFARALKTARAELVFLRDDVSPELSRLGPGASELERIDAAMSRALLVGARALTEKLTRRLEEAFEAAFVSAVMQLPDGGPDDVEIVAAVDAWFGDDGWIRAHVRESEELALALYDRDAEILTQLVDAAIEIASRGMK